jgi:phosphatidate phosphatase APP1
VDWVLIGDDGEHDPEIYRDFARAHPEQVAAIALRTVAPMGTAAPESQETIGAIPVFRAGDGTALAEKLVRSGLLPGHRAEDAAAPERSGHDDRR